jgi:hypothetical protein
VCRLPLCLNPGNRINLAHAHFITAADNPASLQLTQDYNLAMNWTATDDTLANVTRTNTAAGCEYTCDDGYMRVDEG